ncbi:uncharacterized protein LOC110458134 isoform X2 [Mizuhopecten yessoensis]|uniref:uncharacterized protein LOC110458134 isoform X2 n=1 Tax=Mizuhopecten yessoensis TaxID=6573 RepID=UPI000B45CD43|nr:uncharacterized protein LOC110458134 isoform X2 [Mizuhopecten yessoensis]
MCVCIYLQGPDGQTDRRTDDGRHDYGVVSSNIAEVHYGERKTFCQCHWFRGITVWFYTSLLRRSLRRKDDSKLVTIHRNDV